MISEEDLATLDESAYLFRSPQNAARILAAYRSLRAGEGEETSIERLREEFGLRDGE